jgi:hypothetical protein
MGNATLAYFSHSYRPEDRDVNLFFWSLFSEEGFFFSVDPQSKLFSIPYLESMMSQSNCFVAVIPKRDGVPGGCSQYILFEYGLAVQAQKPSLVFVEQGLPGEFFPRDERVLAFNRKRLQAQKDDFVEAIHKLANKVRGFRNRDIVLRQPAGLVLPDTPAAAEIYSPAVVKTLKAELTKYDRQLDEVRLRFDASFRFSLELERFDFLIVEVHERLQLPWVVGYLMGRGVPTIKVRHLDEGETPETAPLPTIVAKHVPRHTKEAPVVYWRTTDELLSGVTAHVARFGIERTEFQTKAAGDRYFHAAGRQKGQVFISNASASAALVQELIPLLRLESIEHFHYQIKDAIPTGARWQAELEQQIRQSRVFLAILTEEFVRSQYCRFELQLALQRRAAGQIEILPFVLSPRVLDSLTELGLRELQLNEIYSVPDEQAAAQMLETIDAALRRTPAAPVPSPALSAPAASCVLTEDQRARLVNILDKRLTLEDAGQRSSWIKLLLVRSGLLTPLAGEDYTGSASIVAVRLLERVEALGMMANGEQALLLLVAGLRTLVSAEQAAALEGLRSELPAAERTGG